MHKRARADSISEAIRAMESGARPALKPPLQCRLRRIDKPFWSGIIESRARDEWSANDLVVAAQLARTQADIESEQAELYAEGSILLNARGTQIMNPRCSVLENLARREMALMRALRMAGASLGATRDADKQRALERSSRDIRNALLDEEDDELIPR